jgi:hypothetical protein
MARAGIGNIDNTYLVFSAFKGYKQLFASSNGSTGITGIDIKGLGAEARWKISPNNFVTTEVAQSISPDFRSSDITENTKFKFSDNSNKAFAVKLSSFYPATRSRIEGAYKFTGSNYQSFSSYQTNSALKSWYVKAEQNFFGRMFKLSAAIRSNDYSNPLILQQYKSNTIFKSVNAAFRKRGWPAMSVGYMPISQLTMVNNQLAESRFQTLNANIYHYYTLRNTNTASTIMFNKFFNTHADSGFVYYNATNIYFAQNIFMGTVVANLSVSDTRNSQYQSQVFDESMQFNIQKSTTLLLGVKINNFNKREVKIGGYVNSGIRVWKNDMLYFSYERGFLPGISNRLIKNDMATIQFTKIFGASKHYSTSIL